MFQAVRYRMYEHVSIFAFFQAKRTRCLSSSSVFGAGSLYAVSSTIIQMVSSGFTSREFAGRSSFGIRFANSSDTTPAWSVHRLFSLQGFPNFGHIPPYLCARNLNIVKMKFFLTLLNYYAFIAFWITFLPQFVKRKDGHLLLSLSSNSKVFTFDHLFTHRSDFFSNFTIGNFFDWMARIPLKQIPEL